jgi:4,5-dihydroxyphthalate decarboxylase
MGEGVRRRGGEAVALMHERTGACRTRSAPPTDSRDMSFKTLLGDYPVVRQFKGHTDRFDFADVKAPATAFKRVVRSLEFDVAELAIVTFLLAKPHGKPLRLLPAVVMARYQHPFLVYDAARGLVTPHGLNGKRIGLRSYSVTTATWVRGILVDDYGVDLSSVRWVTFEEPHVAEFRDPPNVERAAPDKDMLQMLLGGELDAAIVGAPQTDERIRTVIPDPDAAARAWHARTGALQINHMVAVKDTVSDEQAREIYDLLLQSRHAAGDPQANPFGIEANRRNLEVAIDCVYRQGMIPRRYDLDELFR